MKRPHGPGRHGPSRRYTGHRGHGIRSRRRGYMTRINADGVGNDLARDTGRGAAGAARRTHHDASLQVRRYGGRERREIWRGRFCVGCFEKRPQGHGNGAKSSTPTVWDARRDGARYGRTRPGISGRDAACAVLRTHRDASLQVRRCVGHERREIWRNMWWRTTHSVGIG